ncbi:hypothetical protein K443DRAFT_283426 [Laccaria amethystina LaAM-08-1]|uniref:Uncharacterized protein n=1 Tax=Laccaria amethystina LaAM-08-1 TaxID=1095629 RepID=A0A0C9X5J4_9AGAR|nr:hypothetical protein K443DRAFT_283426 [Laccaria amethystina LaAM-08-1]
MTSEKGLLSCMVTESMRREFVNNTTENVKYNNVQRREGALIASLVYMYPAHKRMLRLLVYMAMCDYRVQNLDLRAWLPFFSVTRAAGQWIS